MATLSDSFFVDRSAVGAMAALQADPISLVDSESAGDLSIKTGDRVQVLLAFRGTKLETKQTFHELGLFEWFPGFPQARTWSRTSGYYEKTTGSKRTDFFLPRATMTAMPAWRVP